MSTLSTRRPCRRPDAAAQVQRAAGTGGWVTVRTADKSTSRTPKPRKRSSR